MITLTFNRPAQRYDVVRARDENDGVTQFGEMDVSIVLDDDTSIAEAVGALKELLTAAGFGDVERAVKFIPYQERE